MTSLVANTPGSGKSTLTQYANLLKDSRFWRLVASATLSINVLAICLTTMPASAHVLKTDGDIGVLLHVNPDDTPVSGQPTSFILFITDSSGRFTLPSCSCDFTLKENGKTIVAKPLINSSNTISQTPISFPKPDVYTLVVTGQPVTPNAFQSFTVSYLVRVGSGVPIQQQQPFPAALGWVMGSMIGLVLFGAFAMEYNNNRKKT